MNWEKMRMIGNHELGEQSTGRSSDGKIKVGMIYITKTALNL